MPDRPEFHPADPPRAGTPVILADGRCVLVVADELPRWLAANATAVLGVSLAAHGLIPAGPDLPDAAGDFHPGIGTMPLPVLTAPGELLPRLRRDSMDKGIFVVDFNEAAHKSHTYDEYRQLLAQGSVEYLGLALYGPRKAVASVSGNLKSLK